MFLGIPPPLKLAAYHPEDESCRIADCIGRVVPRIEFLRWAVSPDGVPSAEFHVYSSGGRDATR